MLHKLLTNLSENSFSKAMILVLGLGLTSVAAPASSQENMLGQVILMGTDFCPRGTLRADGQLLPISENSALFSLLGTHYGGDGRTTFALPDLQARSAVHTGNEQRMRIGSYAAGTSSETASATVPGYLVMTYCVVTEGLYPSRY